MGMGRIHDRPSFAKVVSTSLVWCLLVIQFYPVLWVVLTSLKTTSELQLLGPFALPSKLYLGNFVRAWTKADLPLYFFNSTIITIVTILGMVALGSCAAFVIGNMRFRFNKTVLSFFLLGLTIPIHVTLIPLFQIYQITDLINTRLSLILPQIGFNLPLCIYLFTAYFRFVPHEMLEAAVMEGCSLPQAFRLVYLPMSKSSIVTIITMNIIFTWNEFVFANTFISSGQLKTLPVGLYTYIGERGMMDWGATFAAIFLATAPLLLLYFLLNKEIIAGMSAGALKG